MRSNDDANDDKFFVITTFVILVGILCFALVKGCSDPKEAASVLRAAGYKEVKTTGWSPLTCGDDTQCTGFTARSPGGERVSGAVGCGWFFKGCTIRTTGVTP